MTGNPLVIALRLIARHPLYSAINIGGLALGLAGCLLILSYVRYEASYDAWLPDAERVYQVQTEYWAPGQPVTAAQASPYPVRAMLPGAFPQIEAISVVRTGKTVLTRDGQPLFLDSAEVDPAFFDIFQLEFVAGSRERALPDTNSRVITQREAIRQFGSTDVVGKTFTLGAGEGLRDYVVSGVLRDLPRNSSLKLAVLARHDPAQDGALPEMQRSWSGLTQSHYVKLRAGADAAAINAALPAWEKRVISPWVIGGRPFNPADYMAMSLVPITGVHLGKAQESALTIGGDPRALATLAIVAVLTLAIAVMNFVNLSTARATHRAREVALRKVLGATRRQLIVQFLGESLVTAGIATLLALAIVEVAIPWLSGWLDADLRVTYLGEGGLLIPALALVLLTGLVGGLYPAFILSGSQPATVLRANKSASETPGSGRLRTALVVVQFAIAIGLIVCTSVILAQTRFVQTADPGYRRDGLVQIDSAWRFAGSDRYEAARRELMRVPGVVSVGRTDLGLAAANKSVQLVRVPGNPEGLALGHYHVDPGFFTTMEMRTVAGRVLSDRFADDRVPPYAVGEAADGAMLAKHGVNIVVNRAATKLLGFASPQAAVGQEIRTTIGGVSALTPARIVGVVEDTRVRTARDALEPMMFVYDPARTSQVIVRYNAARPAVVMEGVNAVWRRFEPEIPFEGSFAETLIAELYAADRARGAAFAGFAALAIVIACLGLYGLASFTTERRTREIGIRKVLGARSRDIVALLALQFSKPVVLANLIAWPVAWWAMRDWLNGFDARIALGPTPFVVAGVLALAIALATVAGHAIRIARANPVAALRYE